MITREVLRYSDLEIGGVEAHVNRAESHLREGNFRAADAKKLVGTRFYRAKLTDSDALLFTFARHQGKTWILLLEVIRQHNYKGSRFLRGAVVDENKIEEISDSEATGEKAPSLVYINPKLRHFHLLDKIISFDDMQNGVFTMRPPLILIGSAGSGKTVLTLEKLKQQMGRILYVTLSPYLAESARNLYYANQYENEKQNIDFLSYRELLETIRVPEGRELTYPDFARWFERHCHASLVKDTHKVYEEIHGVLTGASVDQPYLSREDYLELGIRQSIFLGEEREVVYRFFTQYLKFLKSEGFYNLNEVAYQYRAYVRPTYDFVVADEVQDLTNVQLSLVLKMLWREGDFILCGDANQVVHPNFFSWSHVKSFFYEKQSEDHPEIMRILNTNYRNAPQVTELANRLLLIKNARFGAIDRESNYLVRPVSSETGEIEFLADEEKIKRELNAKTSRSARAAVIVMRAEDKPEARQYFQTPLLFSIQEAKGLEYETVILFNFVTGNAREFQEIIQGVTADDLLKEELQYSRSKDKGDKSLEAYKFFINAFYVAITRSIRNLCLVERNAAHPLFTLLGLALKKEGVRMKAQVSSQEEWKAEAHRLELQGKKEQAEAIRKVILAQKEVPWPVLTPQNLEKLKEDALNPAHYNRQAKLLLFEYAVLHHVPYLCEALVQLGFKPAQDPSLQQRSVEQKHYQDYLSGNFREIQRRVDLYGVDYRNSFNQTPLMLAARFGRDEWVPGLIQSGAQPHKADNWGRTPLQIALRQAYLSQEFARVKIGRLYLFLAPSSIKVKVGDKMIKLDNKRIEFFLVNSMLALLQEMLRVKIERNLPAFQTADFVHALQHFPDHVILPYRKQRPYLSAALARNEVGRNDPGNRMLFVRMQRGYYILNPHLELEIDGTWVNVYDLIHISELAKEQENAVLQKFVQFIRTWQKENPSVRVFSENPAMQTVAPLGTLEESQKNFDSQDLHPTLP